MIFALNQIPQTILSKIYSIRKTKMNRIFETAQNFSILYRFVFLTHSHFDDLPAQDVCYNGI